jgi:hypothetical protein
VPRKRRGGSFKKIEFLNSTTPALRADMNDHVASPSFESVLGRGAALGSTD